MCSPVLLDFTLICLGRSLKGFRADCSLNESLINKRISLLSYLSWQTEDGVQFKDKVFDKEKIFSQGFDAEIAIT